MGDESRMTDGGPPGVDFSEFEPSSYDEWKASAVASLKDVPFDRSMFTKTYEGITLEPLYTGDHTPLPEAAKTLPGEAPMLRGSVSGYIACPWEIAQDATGSSPEETSRLVKAELERGATAVTFRTHGAGISSAADAAKAIDGVDISKHPFHVYTGASCGAVKYFMEAAKTPSVLSGCIGSDPIGAYLSAGRLPRDFASLMDEMADVIRAAEASSPNLRTVLLRGSVYHDGGANAVQETAYVMASAIELINSMQDRGLDIDDFAKRVRFEFEMGSNFFMEIAKIRAARSVWARITEEYSGDAYSARASVFGRTSYFTKTIYDPYVNMLRNSTEAFSAVLGGVDGLTVGLFDEASRAGGDFSRRVARNAQIMLREEFHLTRPIDPAGGSWYVESLTESLAGHIWAAIQDVQKNGGMIACSKSGHIQKSIDAVLKERFKKLATRADRAIGTNMYVNAAEAPLPGAKPRAKNCRSGGDAEITRITKRRWTEQFDEMRARTEDYKTRVGGNVKIFLANMGPLSQHKARADFITGFMEVANFEALKNDGFKDTDACAKAAAGSNADIAVICSADAAYPELVPPLARRIKELAPSMKVFLAGAPAEEFKQSYIEAGVDDFISVRSDCLAVLCDIQRGKGMM